MMLSVTNLTLSAGEQAGAKAGAKAVAVLRDITLSVARGRVLGLVGESGAGKSMVGRLIAGHTPRGFAVTRGQVMFDGRDLLQLAAAERRKLLGRRIAFIPQEPLSSLNPVMTIGQTFDEHLMLLGVASGERAAAIVNHLAAVHLPRPEAMVRRYPHELSGGQCQRVLIAMAFASDPALLIADEPTTALDVVSQTHILALLKEQQRLHQTAVLLITHDLRLAAHVCDEIAVLYAGEQVERGAAREVLGQPCHPYTRALQAANPDVHGSQRQLPALAGQMPGISALSAIAGCRFFARCPQALAACGSEPQLLREVTTGHWVRCAPGCATNPAPVAGDDLQSAAWSAPVGDWNSPPLVELQEVTLSYTARWGAFGQRKLVSHAVNKLSLRIQPGEFVGIVGESGSGKSSIARLIVGAEAPTAGRINIAGRERIPGDATVARLSRECVQMIFQDPHSALNPRRSVYRLLTQAYELDHTAGSLARKTRPERGAELLADVGLPADALSRYPAQLSGGQKQRVNIGRALCVMPRLLVADEIVSGLDVSVQAQILNLLLELGRRANVALLLISHDLSVVRYLCSRVMVMQAGSIVEEGKTEEVFARPQHPYTQLLLRSVPPADPSIAWPPAPGQKP